MPVMTAHMAAYSTVQMPSEPMMPSGRSRPGLRTSSAAVATWTHIQRCFRQNTSVKHGLVIAGDAARRAVSNPMNEKNTMEAPEKMPLTPNGANGV